MMALLFVLPASGQDTLRLQSDEAPLRVQPGSVGSRPVRIMNEGTEPRAVRLQLALPPGWSVLIPPPGTTLAPGAGTTQLISFRVPPSARSGPYIVRLDPQEASPSFLEWQVVVGEALNVEAEWVEMPALVRAGGQIEATMRVVNRGNASSRWTIQARSSLQYPVEVSPRSVDMEPGEGASVQLRVATRDDIMTRVSHVLSLDIEHPDGANARLAGSTDLVPSRTAGAQRQEGSLPARLSLVGLHERGRQAGQLELRVPETAVGGRLYEVLVRAPDARRSSTFSLPDRYAARVAAQGWEVKVGDHAWEVSELLETGTLGAGIGGRFVRDRLTTGGFVQQSRQVFPERQQAHAFVAMRARPDLQFTVNGLLKRQFEQGESASVEMLYEPGAQYFRAEVAGGHFGDAVGKAAQGELRLEHQRVSFSAQAEAADQQFLGAIQGLMGAALQTQVRLGSSVRWMLQARTRKRSYELAQGRMASQTWTTARTGLTWQHAGVRQRLSLSASLIGQRNDNTLTDLLREDGSAEIRMTWNRRRLGLNTAYNRGQARDPLRPGLSSNSSVQGALFGSYRAFSFSTSGSYTQGPSFYNPVDQERLSMGLNLGWDRGGRTRVNAGLFRIEDRLHTDQRFTMLDAQFLHTFRFGHELSLRARSLQSSSRAAVRNGSLSVSWSVPLSIPVPGAAAERPRLTGRVVDMETGEPVAGAVLRLDVREVMTDETGAFTLVLGRSEIGYLLVDRASIGYSRRPVGTFPMPIDPAMVPPEGLIIEVVRAAALEVEVAVDASMQEERQAALNTSLNVADRAGLLVEIRRGAERIRLVTDREGRARFADLVPGDWSVFLVGASLPEGTRSEPDTLRMSLEPSGGARATLRLVPVRRSVQLVGSGGVRVGGVSVQRVAPVPVQDVAPEAPAPVEAEEPVEVPSVQAIPGQHLILPGETLSSIAQQYYSGSTRHWARLWLANRALLTDPDMILPGAWLTIPPPGRLTAEENTVLRERR